MTKWVEFYFQLGLYIRGDLQCAFVVVTQSHSHRRTRSNKTCRAVIGVKPSTQIETSRGSDICPWSCRPADRRDRYLLPTIPGCRRTRMPRATRLRANSREIEF